MIDLGELEITKERFYDAKTELMKIYNFNKTNVDNSKENKRLLNLELVQERLKDGEYLANLSANIDIIYDCVAIIYAMRRDEDVLVSGIANDFFHTSQIHKSLLTALHIRELLENKHKELTQNGD